MCAVLFGGAPKQRASVSAGRHKRRRAGVPLDRRDLVGVFPEARRDLVSAGVDHGDEAIGTPGEEPPAVGGKIDRAAVLPFRFDSGFRVPFRGWTSVWALYSAMTFPVPTSSVAQKQPFGEASAYPTPTVLSPGASEMLET